MADYHVLGMDRDKDELTVVFHIPIPAVPTNFTGITYRNAIIEKSIQETGAAPVSVLPDIFNNVDITVHKAEIAAGEFYEVLKVIEMDANLSNANKKAIIDAEYADTESEILSELQDTLTFWGYDSDL